MTSAHRRMKESFDANYSALHVRESNHAAFHLYKQTLQYTIHGVEEGYYADGEDAYDMRKHFKAPDNDKTKTANEEEKEEAASETPPNPPEDGGTAAAAVAKKKGSNIVTPSPPAAPPE